MNASDLYALGERFNQNRTLLCFNGPISRSLIEEIGNALKNYLNAEHVRPAEAMDVFSVYIEICLLYTSPSPRDRQKSRMPSSA